MASGSKTPVSLPELHLVAIAKTTRKTLERLASFSHMRSSSESSALLTKILNKINGLVRQIDSSMLAAQMGYQLATNAMILCDTEEADWEANVTRDSLRDLSLKAQEISQSVMEAFRDIKQEVYKIAASTKDSMLVVLVPPDPTHADTMKIHLKDVGADLVANLNLLSEYSRAVASVAEWWQVVKDDLTSTEPSLLPPPPNAPTPVDGTSSDEASTRDPPDYFTQWLEMKQGFQEYYNVINSAHVRFPELLPSSSTAWTSVAYAQSRESSSAGHSQRNLPVFFESSNEPAVDPVARASVKRSIHLPAMFAFRKKAATSAKEVKGKSKEKTPTTENAEEGASNSMPHHDVRSLSNSIPSRHTPSSRSRRSEKRDEKEQERPKQSMFSCRTGSIVRSIIGHLGCHGFMIR